MIKIVTTCSIALSLLMGGCMRKPCPPCVSRIEVSNFTDDLNKGEELRVEVEKLLYALSACQFSAELRERITGLPPELTESNASSPPACRCFDVVAVTPEPPGLVSFELAPASSCDGPPEFRYVVFASLVDNRWFFTWPANLGIPLHPSTSQG